LVTGGSLRVVQSGPREKIVPTAGEKTASIGNFQGVVAEFMGDFPIRKTNWRQNTLQGPAAKTMASGSSGQTPANGSSGQNLAAVSQGLMSSFTMQDTSGSARVVLWNSPGLSGKLRGGQKVQIENGIRRGNEIHISEAGRLVVDMGAQAAHRPPIESIEMEGATVKVKAGELTISWPSLEEACARLGAGAVPAGVDAATIIALKKGDWIGKILPRNWDEKK
jgi:hypothetical protein